MRITSYTLIRTLDTSLSPFSGILCNIYIQYSIYIKHCTYCRIVFVPVPDLNMWREAEPVEISNHVLWWPLLLISNTKQNSFLFLFCFGTASFSYSLGWQILLKQIIRNEYQEKAHIPRRLSYGSDCVLYDTTPITWRSSWPNSTYWMINSSLNYRENCCSCSSSSSSTCPLWGFSLPSAMFGRCWMSFSPSW